MTKLFDLGPVVATPAALRTMERLNINYLFLLAKHARGDWGNLDAADKRANQDALKTGERLLSSYQFGDTKIWVITDAEIDEEHHRQATTILLPDDY
jgi:hypothetical protein